MFPASERPEALSAASMKTVAVVAAVEAEAAAEMLMAVAAVVAEAQEWERGEIAAAGIAVDLAPVLAAVFACLPRSLGALLLSRIS